MKTFLTLGAAILTFAAMPALADHHEGGEKKKHYGAKMFEKHDVDGDGVISKAEFLSHAEDKFAKMDANGDEEITKEEAEAAFKAMKEKWKEKRAEHKEDHDGDMDE